MRSRLIRVSDGFRNLLKETKVARIQNSIDKKLRSDRELSEMIMNCPSFKNVEKELKLTPKKEDLRKL